MHKTNSILMHAPKTGIFETAADLELWPKILPHYRYIHFLERGHDRNVVVMAARRSGIPISWTSEQIIDRDKFEIHFHHLKAWTKGMRVVWTFSDTRDGVQVTILHDLWFRIPLLAPFVDRARREGWSMHELACGHDAMLLDPESTARVLLSYA